MFRVEQPEGSRYGKGTVVVFGHDSWLIVELSTSKIGRLNLATLSIDSECPVENSNWITKDEFDELFKSLHCTLSDFTLHTNVNIVKFKY